MELFNKALAIHEQITVLNRSKQMLLTHLEEELVQNRWQQFYPRLWVSPELSAFLQGDEVIFKDLLRTSSTLQQSHPWYGCIIYTGEKD